MIKRTTRFSTQNGVMRINKVKDNTLGHFLNVASSLVRHNKSQKRIERSHYATLSDSNTINHHILTEESVQSVKNRYTQINNRVPLQRVKVFKTKSLMSDKSMCMSAFSKFKIFLLSENYYYCQTLNLITNYVV